MRTLSLQLFCWCRNVLKPESHVMIHVSSSLPNNWPFIVFLTGVHLSVTQSVFFPLSAVCAPAAEPAFHFPQPQPIVSPDERLCAGRPEGSALVDMYTEPQDSNNVPDDSAIINHLLEIPGLWDMLVDQDFSMSSGYEQGLDTNFNQNFNQNYNENFSNYSDWQFNMLVNENQTPQSEPQENTSNVVQVKTEETLWGFKIASGGRWRLANVTWT